MVTFPSNHHLSSTINLICKKPLVKDSAVFSIVESYGSKADHPLSLICEDPHLLPQWTHGSEIDASLAVHDIKEPARTRDRLLTRTLGVMVAPAPTSDCSPTLILPARVAPGQM